jgi:hypothetical protein
LCGHAALLGLQWLSDQECAVLEDGCGIAEEKVDCTGDGAVAVELALGVDVKRVLVPVHRAVVEGGKVGLDLQCHRLMFLGAGRVLKPNILSNEVIAVNSCISSIISLKIKVRTCIMA